MSQLPFSNNNGTVTSVGLSLPSEFTISGSPVTTSGSLTGQLADQTQNLVFASPDGLTGTPGFRAMVDNDIPDTISLTNITQITNRSILNTTGTLTVARGGTGATTLAGVLKGNGTSGYYCNDRHC